MAVYSIFLLFVLFSITISHIESSNSNGFSMDLIHRDSPKSPFYDPSKTHFRRVRDAVHRSIHRVQHFAQTSNSVSPNTAVADVLSATGEYVMSVSVGTPPFHILAIADTGSDIIWTQCKPCTKCTEQRFPPFDPQQSSTYQQVPCGTASCTSTTGVQGCNVTGDPCQYSTQYGDRSYSNGVVALETLTLQSTSAQDFQIPNIVFGCGLDNEGSFNGLGSGIIGLGGGEVSLIGQMGSTINGKFSYCLVPVNETGANSGRINFGSNGVVSGEGVATTPLLFKTPRTYYYLTLEAISVGNERVEYKSVYNPTEGGNIIIDSGTTLTFLPQDFYMQLKTVVVNQVKAVQIPDPSQGFDLCYDSVPGLAVPDITVHFRGADVKLNMFNTFIKILDHMLCFSFAPAYDGVAIYGNLAQMNFLVGYDIQGGTVSFKPADCSKN